MNQNKLMDALGHLDEELLLETETRRQNRGKGNHWRRWSALAACLVLLLTVAAYAGSGWVSTDHEESEMMEHQESNGSNQEEKLSLGESHYGSSTFGINIGQCLETGAEEDQTKRETVKENRGLTIPPAQVYLGYSEDVAMDMMAFFIYGGRSYVEYRRVIDERGTLLGDYVATATGLIDEWTPEDGYVELAGSVSGEIYTVQGYDPAFMLCMKEESGAGDVLLLYVNDSGITLNSGADLFRYRLMLDGHYAYIQYETRESWNYGLGQLKTLPESAGAVWDAFRKALNQGVPILIRDIPLDEGESNLYDSRECYHLYIHKADGVVVHLRLFEGGYVSFQGIWTVAFQVEQEAFDGLLQSLQEA